MTIIKPTVGRIVHVYIDGNYALNHEPKLAIDRPLAAVITHVHSDSLINAAVFTHDGSVFPMLNLLLVQDDAAVTDGDNYAVWMPYQKGQAAKTEALEKALELPVVDAMPEPKPPHANLVRLFLNRGSIVKVNGIPLELEHDVVVRTHPNNVALLTPDSINACKSEVAD